MSTEQNDAHPDDPLHGKARVSVDDHARWIRRTMNAKGVLLILFDMPDGKGGMAQGLSVQASPDIAEHVPELLRKMAGRYERDMAFNKAQGKG